jgi:ubiquinone biosynthesis protein COQ9
VPFDGWSHDPFTAAIRDSGLDATVARAICPRGAVDLAVAYHRRGDAAMVAQLPATDLAALRYSDRVAFAIRARLEAAADKEAVRRGSTLFALPQHAADGARLIWGTADVIWDTLGDTARDYNWYTKRASLAAVYSSAVLYWLGDTSDGDGDTHGFIDRRIENVMQFETLKSSLRNNRIAMAVFSGPLKVLERISAPQSSSDLPGQSQR